MRVRKPQTFVRQAIHMRSGDPGSLRIISLHVAIAQIIRQQNHNVGATLRCPRHAAAQQQRHTTTQQHSCRNPELHEFTPDS